MMVKFAAAAGKSSIQKQVSLIDRWHLHAYHIIRGYIVRGGGGTELILGIHGIIYNLVYGQ